MAKTFPKKFMIFSGILLLVNLLQSHFTELIYDESYYWYYAQNMAWGYFDHPPMVALMIKIGLLFSKTEIGVRLVSCFFCLGGMALLWLMVDDERKKDHIGLFFMLFLSMPLLNAYGFFTLPDTPLLFFTCLFLYLYKQFLRNNTWVYAFFLGLTMAAMMYSKYHGLLIIVFVFLSNIGLIKNPKAWFAVVVALMCYVPHILWLYEVDFAPIVFHISERPNQAYNFAKFTLGYFLNLIVIFGLVFPWAYWALFKSKRKDRFERALLFLSYGFILFFFISSFNRRVQAQWAITICLPILLLTYNYLLNNPVPRKWFSRVAMASLIILAYARLWLIHLPLFPKVYESHRNKAFAERIKKEVGDIPVVFENSYRRASMYQFYSGNVAYTMNNLFYRKNQYSLDNSEDKIHNKRVAYISGYYPAKDFKVQYKEEGFFNGTYFDNFVAYQKLVCIVEDSIREETKKFKVSIYNPYQEDIAVKDLNFFLGLSDAYKKTIKSIKLQLSGNSTTKYLRSKDTTLLEFDSGNTNFEDYHYIKIGVSKGDMYPGLNSKPYPIYGN